MIAQKQRMKMTIRFCETTIKETEHEIKEVDSKLQSNLSSTEYSNIKEHVGKNQELDPITQKKENTQISPAQIW